MSARTPTESDVPILTRLLPLLVLVLLVGGLRAQEGRAELLARLRDLEAEKQSLRNAAASAEAEHREALAGLDSRLEERRAEERALERRVRALEEEAKALEDDGARVEGRLAEGLAAVERIAARASAALDALAARMDRRPPIAGRERRAALGEWRPLLAADAAETKLDGMAEFWRLFEEEAADAIVVELVSDRLPVAGGSVPAWFLRLGLAHAVYLREAESESPDAPLAEGSAGRWTGGSDPGWARVTAEVGAEIRALVAVARRRAEPRLHLLPISRPERR